MENKDDFLKNLLEIFRIEAAEHVKTLSAGLVALEQTPSGDSELEGIIEEIFRAAHSLKGAARTMNLMDVESLCHAVENIFSLIKSHKLDLSPTLFDVLHDGVDYIDELTQQKQGSVSQNGNHTLTILLERLKKASTQLDSAIVEDKRPEIGSPFEIEDKNPANQDSYTPQPELKVKSSDTLRISAAKLDALLLQTEEFLPAKLVSAESVAAIRDILNEVMMLKKAQKKCQPLRKKLQQMLETPLTDWKSTSMQMQLSQLLDLTNWEAAFVQSFEPKLGKLVKSLEQNQYSMSQLIDGLLGEIKNILMLPISSTLDVFPKLVRDIAHTQGKKVKLQIRGAEKEIDRRILDEMYDPLIHLIRNCIDHGIEAPEERKLKNKPPHGTITIATHQKDGGHIEIIVSDDGAGIDVNKIQDKAKTLGLLSQTDNELSDDECLALIFQSGISTSPLITDLSGRGLGLAIVWEKTEKLGGVISVETTMNQGTTFRICLPLTLATFRGVYVRVRDQLFLLPTMQIEQCLRVKTTAIKAVENKDTILWREEVVPVVKLADVLELPPLPADTAKQDLIHLVILGNEKQHIAFGVDDILSEEDILIKSFNKQLTRVRNIMGATVLGNGKAVPILNVIDLLRSAMKDTVSAYSFTKQTSVDEEKTKSILVVEDSITSRTLLKNILESAGYKVSTAVNGMEGLTRLKNDRFDLVMSDVNMPKMNGFDLTAKIRADKALEHLPIVLVTSLDSREDRERGINAGADAYLVKSNFDQGNLLDVVGRLI